MTTILHKINIFSQSAKSWATQILQKRNYSDIDKLQAPHKVDSWEKRFLVWTGKYKTLEEVPAFVGQHVMERARNRMRIKIANYMMLATIAGCLVMVYLGKQDAKKGDSVIKRNLEWHKQVNEEAEKSAKNV